MNVLRALLSNANLWKNPFSTTDFICTKSHRAQTNPVFSQIQPLTQITVIITAMIFAQWCVTPY